MKSLLTPLRIALASQLRGRILDCGAGEGLFTPYLNHSGNRLVNLDIDENNLKKLPGENVVASCADVPFDDNHFDCVWACAIIEHIEEDVVPELIRVTKPGGRIIIVTPNKYSPFDPIKRLFAMPTWDKLDGHIHLYTEKELNYWGKVHGETRFLPRLQKFFWNHPRLSHILILDICVDEELKQKALAMKVTN